MSTSSLSKLKEEIFFAWCNDTKQTPSRETAIAFKRMMDGSDTDKFVCRSRRLGHVTTNAITNYLLMKPKTKMLDLHENTIRDKGAIAISEFLQTIPSEDLNQELPCLKILNIGSNDIGNEGIHSLCEALTKSICKLETLILGSEPNELYVNKFDHLGGMYLAKALQQNSFLTCLDLNRVVLLGKKSQDAFRELSESLRINKNLKKLCLGCCNMNSSSAILLLESLKEYENLNYLDLSENMLTSEIASSLGDYLSSPHCKLSVLLLQNNLLKGKGFLQLSTSLQSNTSITQLNLSNNHICSENVEEQIVAFTQFATVLSNPSSKMSSLNLSKNGMEHVEIFEVLASALEKNTKMRSLDLSENRLHDSGTKAISKFLSSPSTAVQTLILSEAGIGDSGAVALVVALATNQSVLKLFLHNNHLGQECGKILIEVLTKNVTLEHLELKGNQIDHSVMLRLHKLLDRNKEAKLQKEPTLLRKELYRLQYNEMLTKEKMFVLEQETMKRGEAEARVRGAQSDNNQILNKYQSQKDELISQLQAEETVSEDLVVKIKTREADLTKYRTESEAQIQNLTETVDQILAGKEQTDAEIKQKEDELDRIKNREEEEISLWKEEIALCKDKGPILQQEVASLSQQLQEAQQKLKKLEEEFTDKKILEQIYSKIDYTSTPKSSAPNSTQNSRPTSAKPKSPKSSSSSRKSSAKSKK